MGRCLALAALAPLALGNLAMAQPAAAPPVLAIPAAPVAPAPPPVEIPALTPAQAQVALKALRAADLHGLQPKAYVPDGLPDDGTLTPAQQTALAAGLVRYAHDVRIGRMDPGQFPELWQVRPAAYDPRPDLAAALTEGRLQPWLDSLAPRYSGYAALKRGLVRYREIAGKGGWKTVAEGPKMELGSKDPRVAALRARLAVEDSAVTATGAATFDKPLEEAVIRAQRRYGLKPDGVVGNGTLAYLNQPVGQRILQIVANMERWRWMPATMPATRVQVNTGAAIVTLFRDDKPIMSMKAVSGRPGDETPMLVSTIHSVVINPPWNVPAGIAQRELWPKEKANPGYLAKHGYRIIPVQGGQPRLQQASGDQSALGRFKFDFDNPFAVYLHDTPSKGGFDLYSRQASHGCVRLERPRALAEALLNGDATWTSEAIDKQLEGDKTVRAKLSEQVPVYILYWTAFGGSDGQMNFRSDPYNWDRELLQRTGVLASGTKV
ncbi:MAG: L,D-transpeptidase family protein [Alphaproteobacteria bacterium]|nr:L,D-transpeptidase family protein [Alphaproteobacteria bacterium]MBU1513281.1 L,D-transpeptidase family protein [Alphaproteobacteria bacterium]MBU2093599.1 L,D-transpeptidase family protein [Alphaproteobacteria bacterium]MBU2151957.1 L,D-transpeptidase family protein [Alphaproteobacteria bacterium]MBU2307617.1 L,D-transpeptidase family protein [Alphaproteobacteria bacterium]